MENVEVVCQEESRNAPHLHPRSLGQDQVSALKRQLSRMTHISHVITRRNASSSAQSIFLFASLSNASITLTRFLLLQLDVDSFSQTPEQPLKCSFVAH